MAGDNGVNEPLLRSISSGSDVEEAPIAVHTAAKCSWVATTASLLALQLGWGLWLFPSDFARLGWHASAGVLLVLGLLTAYSGHLFARLYNSTPGAVLFGDIGYRAVGAWGRNLVYVIIYTLDASRCVILHLAATQSLRHIFPEDQRPPLWECGLVVLVLASVLVQIRSLAELSWVFATGTGSQLVAIGIVLYELISNPDPNAHREDVAVRSDNLVAPTVAVMNMIFAFGGQFAFVEIMTSMAKPTHFPRAVSLCTAVMALLYGGLGVVGYWSRGDAIKEIVIFSLPDSPRSRIAAAFILVQAISQYLVNLNVWTHNILVLKARLSGKPHDHVRCSTDHCKWQWLGWSLFVVAYSYGISISLPFFSTLVGLVTAGTYLLCAYALPSWFTLKLLPSGAVPTWERALLWSLIPLSIIVSGIGLWASVVTLINDVGGGGEGGWGNALGVHFPQAVAALLRGSS